MCKKSSNANIEAETSKILADCSEENWDFMLTMGFLQLYGRKVHKGKVGTGIAW